VRYLGRRPASATVGGPLEAAQRRLAAGEISAGEYDEIVHRLRTEPPPGTR